MCMHAKSMQLCPTLCESMDCSLPGFSVHGILISRQEYWRGLLCPPPGDLPHPGIERASPVSPALQPDSFTTEPFGKPSQSYMLSSKSEFLLF